MSSNENVASLAPCPFCGQQDAFVEQLDSDASVVICQGRVGEHSACLARGPVGIQEDENETQPGHDAAVREWNNQSGKSAEQHPAAVGLSVDQREGEQPDLNFQLLLLAERSCSLLEDWLQATDTRDGPLTEQIRETRALIESQQPTWSIAAYEILAERRRQIHVEGYTASSDDEHEQGQLADAAASYAFFALSYRRKRTTPLNAPSIWPWDPEHWKPTGQRQMLIRAGALLLAELERIDRLAAHGGAQ